MSKRYGVTVNVYADGCGGGSDISLTCDHSGETDWKCPFAIADEMPMKSGDRCMRRGDGACPMLVAQIDALKVAKNAIDAKIREIKEGFEE